MIRNVKKFRPFVKSVQLVDGTFVELSSQIAPMTFILPQEYSLFVEEFNRDQGTKWIFKPSNQSQGKGIQIVSKAAQVKQLQQHFPSGVNQFK